jgi:glycine cleavage system H protein
VAEEGVSELVPQDLKYSKDHEWVRVEDGEAVIGITDYAQSELGDVVFIELPKVGDSVTATQAFGVVESVKAASDLYAPVSGEVVAVNDELVNQPELVNKEPYGGAWMIRVRMSDPSELDALLSAADYESLIAS